MKKTTSELIKLMNDCHDYKTYLNENKDDIQQEHMKINRALSMIVAEKKLKKSEVIAKSGIENHYAYQIFSGTKNPTRDKVIMLCFGMELSEEETQQLLKITGYAQLYGKEERDNIFIFGLKKHMNIIDVNSILYEMNLELLS